MKLVLLSIFSYVEKTVCLSLTKLLYIYKRTSTEQWITRIMCISEGKDTHPFISYYIEDLQTPGRMLYHN